MVQKTTFLLGVGLFSSDMLVLGRATEGSNFRKLSNGQKHIRPPLFFMGRDSPMIFESLLIFHHRGFQTKGNGRFLSYTPVN